MWSVWCVTVWVEGVCVGVWRREEEEESLECWCDGWSGCGEREVGGGGCEIGGSGGRRVAVVVMDSLPRVKNYEGLI